MSFPQPSGRFSSHAQDRLPSLRKLLAHVAQIGAQAEPTKANRAEHRARQADLFFALSEPRERSATQ